MDAREVLDQIEAHAGDLPRVRYVPELYAEKVAALAPKLTPGELKELVELGALIKNRCSRLIPVYRLDNMPDHILQGVRPIN